MTKPKDAAAAIITIRDGHKMTPRGRRAIAAWMRRNADWFLKHGRELAPTFRARYLYAKKGA